MIQGLRTVIYPSPDLAAGKAWYTQVLQAAPYFDQPFMWVLPWAASSWG